MKNYNHRYLDTRLSSGKCLYCNNPADSRDHLPSKAFLKNNEEGNFSTVPSCVKCNNKFSKDEEYFLYLVENLVKKTNIKNHETSDEMKRAFMRNSNLELTIYTLAKEIAYQGKELRSIEFAQRILQKYAMGHLYFEESKYVSTPLDVILMKARHEMTNEELLIFE